MKYTEFLQVEALSSAAEAGEELKFLVHAKIVATGMHRVVLDRVTEGYRVVSFFVKRKSIFTGLEFFHTY